MRLELDQAIAEWKKEAIYESREVAVKKVSTGEYIIVISAAIDLVVEDKQESVYQYKFLLTMAQSPDTRLNPTGDVYQFKKASDLVISKFFDRCSTVIEHFINGNDPSFTPL